MIRIVLFDRTVRNGERLKGSVSWRAESKQARKVEVVVRWKVEGRGRTREEVIERLGHDHPPPEMTIPFEVEIPIWGPLSYDGKLLRVIWEVEATADLPLARDESEVEIFTVVPRPWNAAEWAGLDD